MSNTLKNGMLTIALLAAATVTARADLEPTTKAPSADQAALSDQTGAVATGFATGQWIQAADGHGRVMADLMTFDGKTRLVLVADLAANPNSPEIASQMSGTISGYLHRAGSPDPWKTTSNLVVMGNWKRTFDSGSFELVIIERDGLNEHVALAGHMSGTFGADHELIFQKPASDAVRRGSNSDIVGGKNVNADAYQSTQGGPEKIAPTPGTLYLVAPVLARWYLY